MVACLLKQIFPGVAASMELEWRKGLSSEVSECSVIRIQTDPETLALELGRASVLLENEAAALAWGAQLRLVLCRRPAGPRQNPQMAEVSQV